MDELKAHALKIEDILSLLRTSPEGLSEEEARKRLSIYGRNEIETEEESLLTIFLRQFRSPLVYILLAASIFSLLLGKSVDFFLIVGIVLVNSLIGFFQEYKAVTSLKSLRRHTELRAKVFRDGRLEVVPTALLVPGDVVLVKEGDVVPADIRLLAGEGLLVDEAILTGESIPVEKDEEPTLPEETPLYKRKNILFKGTVVVRGWGKGVVYATGRNTELGKIALRAQESSPDTPLMRALKRFSRVWMLILIGILLSLLLIGLFQGRDLYEVVMLVIAELVSAVPEGLPIVITLVLVVGSLRLARRRTYIRYLPAAETLGSTTYIATDKTGTITQGRLKVEEVYEIEPEHLRLISALCNNSDGSGGDPLEVALLRWLEEEGYDWRRTREECPRTLEFPFDTKRRYMATVHRCEGRELFLIKGALESLLQMAEGEKEELARRHDEMAERGLRVIAFGYSPLNGKPTGPEEVRIRIAGLIGFMDPPKEGVKEAVESARRAGVRIIMLTGDNLKTAKAVAREVGIYREGDWAVEGRQIESYSDEELYTALKKVSVVARALPEDKYRIVRVLQSRGEIVAVTGDGVNDVPALKVADIGVAMGSGSQAAIEVAKMVITDNNLSVIVDAIKAGREIARNIRRAIIYLLSASFGEVLLLSLSFLLRLPLPLYPTQILWINLVTDGVQDKAFPFNREEEDVMKTPPKKPEKVFLDRRLISDTLTTALVIGLVNLFLFLHSLGVYDYGRAVSLVFTSMVANQWVVGVQTVRDRPFLYKPWRNFTQNPYIYLGLTLGVLLQLSALYLFPGYLHSIPLSHKDWLYVALTSGVVFLFIEARKLLWWFLGAHSSKRQGVPGG